MKTIAVSGEIYGYYIDYIINQIKENQPDLIEVNSGGGDVFSGWSLGNEIQLKKIDTRCTAMAGSIASYILLSGNKVTMYKNSMLMIHNASFWGGGNSDDLNKVAESLDKIDELLANFYVDNIIKRIGGERDVLLKEIKKMMDAETMLTADECKDLGLIDEVVNAGLDNIDNKFYKQFLNSINKKQSDKMVVTEKELSAIEKLVAFFKNETKEKEVEAPKVEPVVEAPKVEDKTTDLSEKEAEIEDLKNKLDAEKLKNQTLISEKEALQNEKDTLLSEKETIKTERDDFENKFNILNDSRQKPNQSRSTQFQAQSNTEEEVLKAQFEKNFQIPAYVPFDMVEKYKNDSFQRFLKTNKK